MVQNLIMTKKDHAVAYLKLGFSVFPTRGKKPLVAWEKYQHEMPTEDQIKQWWDSLPDADIGAVTGAISGIVVVDIDGGEVPQLPPTAVSQTSPGHFQYFFKHSGFPVKNSAKEIAPNTDIRGDGGFVVVPPSDHFQKETGEKDFTYTWLIPPEEAGFAELPTWIIEKLQTKKSITEIAKGTEQGSRNVDTTSYIGYLLHNSRDLSNWQTLWELIKAWNLTNVKPPQEEQALWATFKGLLDKQLAAKSGNIDPQIFTPKLLADLKEADFPIEWVWEGFLAKGYITLLSALWKAGKTTLIALLLKALQSDSMFLGQTIHPVSVLIISEEGEGLWVRRRVEYNIQSKVWILSRPIKRRLNYDEWISLLEQEAKFCVDSQVEVLIIDTISNFWSVDNESDAPKLEAALLPLNHLLENNIAVLLIHHFRKSGGEEGTASRGSGALASKVDIIVEFKRLQGEESSTKRVIKTYSRFEETPSEIVIELEDDEYKVLGTKVEVVKQKKLDVFKIELEKYSNGATISEIRADWSEDKAPSDRTLRRYAKELFVKGEISNVGTKDTPVWKLNSDIPNREESVLSDNNLNNQSFLTDKTTDGQDISPIELSTSTSDNKLIKAAEEIFGVKTEEPEDG